MKCFYGNRFGAKINEFIRMFNYATIKHLLLLYSDIFEDRSNSSFTFRLFHFYSRLPNMNIGTWPLEHEELTDSHVQYREITSKETNQLFWTKGFLQTSPYDEKRYRQITSNACERIVQEEESKKSSSRSTPSRPSSIIALSLSETSTRQTSSNNHSTPQTRTLPIESRKKSSHTRFSCYLKSHNIKNRSKQTKKRLPITIVPKNNNHYHDKIQSISSKKNLIQLTNDCREKMCQKCSKILQTSSTHISSNLLCPKCFLLIENFNQKKFHLNKIEENELRQIIEIIIEEFQDHFNQTLNLSIKQMTQHLLSNIHLFYNHYQQEFEQLTKKYRLTFLERFIQLMNKFQISQTNSIQKTKPTRNSITHPPDILSMSSLSGSLATEKDRSETMTQLITPSDSISLSTTSNPSIIIGEKRNRKHHPIQNSSSKKTFTLNRTGQKQRLSSSSLQLIDAYRFRDTLRMNSTQFSSPRPKIR